MTCDEFENRFLAGQENELSAHERAALEKHLTDCAACRTLARQLQRLDAALTIKIKAPELSANFQQRLAARIQAGPAVLPQAQREERKRQLLAEYEAGLAKLGRRPLPPGVLLEGLRYAFPVALAGWLAWQFMPGLVPLLASRGLSGSGQNLLLASAAALLFLAIGLAATYQRKFQQLWFAN
jgi:anti-sigma factor RsiW